MSTLEKEIRDELTRLNGLNFALAAVEYVLALPPKEGSDVDEN